MDNYLVFVVGFVLRLWPFANNLAPVCCTLPRLVICDVEWGFHIHGWRIFNFWSENNFKFALTRCSSIHRYGFRRIKKWREFCDTPRPIYIIYNVIGQVSIGKRHINARCGQMHGHGSTIDVTVSNNWMYAATSYMYTCTYTRPANPDMATPVSMAIKTCEKTCKKFASQVSRHDNAD